MVSHLTMFYLHSFSLELVTQHAITSFPEPNRKVCVGSLCPLITDPTSFVFPFLQVCFKRVLASFSRVFVSLSTPPPPMWCLGTERQGCSRLNTPSYSPSVAINKPSTRNKSSTNLGLKSKPKLVISQYASSFWRVRSYMSLSCPESK